MKKVEKADKPLIGQYQEWHEKEYNCHMCDFHKIGVIRESYPKQMLTSLWVCPNCRCGRENRLGDGVSA